MGKKEIIQKNVNKLIKMKQPNFTNKHIHSKKSISDLISEAKIEKDIKKRWTIIVDIQARANHETFKHCKKLCLSSSYKDRVLGIDILAQLGVYHRPFKEETVPIFIDLFKTEKSLTVLSALFIGCGHLVKTDDHRFIPYLLKFIEHKSRNLRFGVVFGIMGHEEHLAIKALIQLTEDIDDDVRNYATFALGSQVNSNNCQVIGALEKRLLDNNDEIVDEAILGLALRKKFLKITKPILSILKNGEPKTLLLEAAGKVPNDEIYFELKNLYSLSKNDSSINTEWLSSLREALSEQRHMRN